MFERKKPCKSCPFRVGGEAVRFLGESRAREISDTLTNDGTFTCHDDIDLPDSNRQHCVGAMIILEKNDNPNQMMRICERLGYYDHKKLTGYNEVFDDFEDWIECQVSFD